MQGSNKYEVSAAYYTFHRRSGRGARPYFPYSCVFAAKRASKPVCLPLPTAAYHYHCVDTGGTVVRTDPGDRETEFSHGSILGIDGARPRNYEYDHQNGLNAGQHIGFQADLGL